MPAANDIRRVVTTHDASGKAIVGFDNVAPQTGGEAELGVKVFNLWVTDATPADISGKTDAATRKVGIPPPPNGSIFRIVEFHPTPKADDLDPNFLAKIAGKRRPGGHQSRGQAGATPRHASHPEHRLRHRACRRDRHAAG